MGLTRLPYRCSAGKIWSERVKETFPPMLRYLLFFFLAHLVWAAFRAFSRRVPDCLDKI